MASNIKVQRVCQYCSKEFTARTTVTRYCSDDCAKRGYKVRKRDESIEKSNNETQSIKTKTLSDIKDKDFLTVPDAATLLNFSNRTVYRLIKEGKINAVNLAHRKTLIRRVDIDTLFELPRTIVEVETPNQIFNIDECYTLKEVQDKYRISETALQNIIKRNNIPKKKIGWYAYIPKTIIDAIFS